MRRFKLEVEGEAREVYVIEAEDEAAARRLFDDGDAGQPEVVEVTSAEITTVTEMED